jgi:hypothetical protein
MLRRLLFLSLLLAVSGCTIPTGPNFPSNNIVYGNYTDDLFRPAIPEEPYDGIFTSYLRTSEYLDSAGTDTQSFQYGSEARMYNKFGDLIFSTAPTFSVRLNGNPLTYFFYGFDTNLNLQFPSPVTWSMVGDDYFPSFIHTLSSENPVEISTPVSIDSQISNVGFEVTYNAPGVDTVTLRITYFGKGIFLGDTTGKLQDADQSQFPMTANSGHFRVPPFTIDTSTFKSFTPQFVEADIAWGHGDTIHVDGKVFGLVTVVECSRDYYFKQ